jgi:DNA-binding transcriptional regulator YdaS (Cro superfamily)
MTQVGLAKELGVHPITVSKWETGALPIPDFSAKAIEATLAEIALRKVKVRAKQEAETEPKSQQQ